MHIRIKIQTQISFSTQKNGLRSKSMSLSVPPPKAAKPETIAMPTISSFFRAASISPDRAKARVPMMSKRMVPFRSSQLVSSMTSGQS